MTINETSQDACPVVVCVADNNYVQALCAAIHSGLINLKRYPKILLFLIHEDISDFNRNMILKSIPPQKADVQWLPLPPGMLTKLKKLKVDGWLAHAIYFRIYLPELLPAQIEKAIYLDSDLLIQGDLGELWDMDMEGKAVSAVPNLDWRVSSVRGLKNYKELGLSADSKYFNSGVIVFNLARWRQGNISDKVVQSIEHTKGESLWPDQDALNTILANDWKELDRLWNYEALMNPYDEEAISQCHILHFTGPCKPWHDQYSHPTKELFFHYLDMTAWSGWRPRKLWKRGYWFLDMTRPYRHSLGLSKSHILQIIIILKSFLLKVKGRLGLPPKLKNRSELPVLLNALGLKGTGVEIGVYQGSYSEAILRKSSLSKLYSIDPWKIFPSEEYADILNSDENELYEAYLTAIRKLSRFKNRSKILKTTSEKAVMLFKDEELDFVYIDAQHAYGPCQRDIRLWWPKVRRGGVFAGHDYLSGKLPEGDFGVKDAVDEFVKEHQLTLFITQEQWPTWYILKDETVPLL
ncbi:MAG: glycosyltransferase [Candidatus Omnitrophota bacterium]